VCELASRHLPRPDEAPREAVEALLREALAAELEAVPFPLEPFLLSRAPAVCAPRAWPWRCLPSWRPRRAPPQGGMPEELAELLAEEDEVERGQMVRAPPAPGAVE